MGKARNNISAARREYSRRTGVKFTQEDAAREFGVSLSAYRNYEQEVNLPNASTISAMAAKYGVTVDYLLAKTQNPNPVGRERLTPDEQELLDCYRRVPKWERDLILGHAKMVLAHARH